MWLACMENKYSDAHVDLLHFWEAINNWRLLPTNFLKKPTAFQQQNAPQQICGAFELGPTYAGQWPLKNVHFTACDLPPDKMGENTPAASPPSSRLSSPFSHLCFGLPFPSGLGAAAVLNPTAGAWRESATRHPQLKWKELYPPPLVQRQLNIATDRGGFRHFFKAP